MEYNSIEEIKKIFKLSGSTEDEIRIELNRMRIKAHPDRNGGNFQSKIDKDNYHIIDEAINFIDGIKETDKDTQPSSALIPISEFRELIKTVTELIPNNNQQISQQITEQKIKDQINSNLVNYKRKSLFPKIGLTAITAVVSFIFLFPKTISDHPILKLYFEPERKEFSVFWFATLFITISYWIFTFNREERTKVIISRLKTESEQNRIFLSFIADIEYRKELENIFTKDSLTEFILYNFKHRNLFLPNSLQRAYRILTGEILFSNLLVDEELAQTISENILNKAVAKNIIKKLTLGM